MPNDLINLIPKDAEEVAAFIEAARTIGGASKSAQSAVLKYFGPALERNWRRITEKAKQLRDKVSTDRQTPPTSSLLIPLVDAASQENREELQDLWAALLANSMIDGGKKVRREYLDVVKRLEPLDVIVLKIIMLPLPVTANSSHPNAWPRFREDHRNETGLGLDDWHVSVKALTELGCVSQNSGQEPFATPFARMLIAACEVS